MIPHLKKILYDATLNGIFEALREKRSVVTFGLMLSVRWWVRRAWKADRFSAANDPTRTSGLELVDRTKFRHG